MPFRQKPAKARPGHPRLPRVIRTVCRSIELSSPAPGRLKVIWMEGINPGMIRELWPSQGRLPYKKRELPPHISSMIPGARESWPREKRLWDEVCQVERRGRPCGTGHPKRRLPDFPLSSEHIDRLRKVGLDDIDLQIFFGKYQGKTFEQIGHELSMSAQAGWKRWTCRIEPALKKLNPQFSTGSFKLSSLDSK